MSPNTSTPSDRRLAPDLLSKPAAAGGRGPFGPGAGPPPDRGPRSRRVSRILHGVGMVLGGLASGLFVANVWLPIAPASGQSAPIEERGAGAARLDARSEDGNNASLPLVGESLSVRFDDGHVAETFDHAFQNETRARLEG